MFLSPLFLYMSLLLSPTMSASCCVSFFFFNDTATTEIYTLSLHDALPIRFLRDGAIMVMGIVSTKTQTIEREEELLRRMEEAAGLVGSIDRLAISPQCGFASVMVGNEIDEDTQWRKLELVAQVADRLWGTG